MVTTLLSALAGASNAHDVDGLEQTVWRVFSAYNDGKWRHHWLNDTRIGGESFPMLAINDSVLPAGTVVSVRDSGVDADFVYLKPRWLNVRTHYLALDGTWPQFAAQDFPVDTQITLLVPKVPEAAAV